MSTLSVQFRLKLAAFELDVQLELPAIGISVITGSSGSGKTLLLRCIAGLERPALAYCKVKEIVWEDSTRNYSLAAYQRPLGYVFQESCLFPHLNVQQNIDYGRKRLRLRSNPSQSLDTVIELLNIGHLLKRSPAKLSGGEKQRVAIARALAVDPQLLLMDEPLASLDQAHKYEILPYLRRLQWDLQLPVLYITHSPQEMTQLADHLVLMDKGKILASGELQAVLTRLDLPLAQSQRASSVLTAEVFAYDAAFQLLQLRFSGGVLSVPHLALPKGSQLRVRIYARDVSLALQPPASFEPFNSLHAQVLGIMNQAVGYTTVSLRVGAELLLAQVTRKTASFLQLKHGQIVYAEIKNAAILS
ncbi:molybdenum ABC transporter ATP-binding protein [uncultured Thiothrix sp.]|uniref:molybdenum ABC transporter ATP-binding protein n=1 Tax=uncultured Thiothrix sp. TaxID=223185 RepID=UPI002630C491|nr:molybdenum ABC transporter ATP-binding protein [uncultured Thiothrix sp.]HMT92026.1 molybdenum ABC transporter ATP-binding protein [Thiolinea sp.]